jgi:hypothetical protein
MNPQRQQILKYDKGVIKSDIMLIMSVNNRAIIYINDELSCRFMNITDATKLLPTIPTVFCHQYFMRLIYGTVYCYQISTPS